MKLKRKADDAELKARVKSLKNKTPKTGVTPLNADFFKLQDARKAASKGATRKLKQGK